MRTLILASAIVSPFVFAGLWLAGAPWIGFVLMVTSHALVLYPTLRPNAQWLGPVVTRFDTREREVWLTIDDGPAGDTPQLLEVLDAAGVKATFFVKGKLAEENHELTREIVARGHTVGNHSYSHPSATFWCLPPRRIAEEIDRGTSVLQRFTTTTLFRAPVGMKNPFVHPALRRRSLQLIGWSARSFDAVKSDVERIAHMTAEATSPGAIIVMHQGRPWSVRAIERVVRELSSRGYRFVIPAEERFATKR